MRILVTGGAGYIGSHTCVELLNPKEEVITIRCFSDTTTGLPAARIILKDNFYFAS